MNGSKMKVIRLVMDWHMTHSTIQSIKEKYHYILPAAIDEAFAFYKANREKCHILMAADYRTTIKKVAGKNPVAVEQLKKLLSQL
ncbi:MAG: hypothetical protein G01um101418_33 [Parcubacteria group bacterium Gr01-1014_18]|nr:MAG: hypothetical protein Greene041636_33 [Parcubacteria group bacterium Greene0416_36]TSC81539.1 MAG: hypothetical protein G01um101418_33 [Parcubacteria group bacterium Gr01-1014_18]TSC99650.1 MAG: hypothetical protein Greene101420_54 [Parcubacteria group bacterium Greene1014_20]TSD07101.1 MAG: hypothetical protein Greene07142_413 [Parcubacteria group bacterium Greene0714_2]